MKNIAAFFMKCNFFTPIKLTTLFLSIFVFVRLHTEFDK